MEINDITRNNVQERTPVRVFLVRSVANPFIGKHFQEDSFSLVGYPLKGVRGEYGINIEKNEEFEKTLEIFNEQAYRVKEDFDHSKSNEASFPADMLKVKMNTKFTSWHSLQSAIENKQVYFAAMTKKLKLEPVYISILSEDIYQRILSNNYLLNDGTKLSEFPNTESSFFESQFVLNVLKEAGYPARPAEWTYEGLNHSEFQQKLINIEKRKTKKENQLAFKEIRYLSFKWSELKTSIVEKTEMSLEEVEEFGNIITEHWDLKGKLYIHKDDITDELYQDNHSALFAIMQIKNMLNLDRVNIVIDFSS